MIHPIRSIVSDVRLISNEIRFNRAYKKWAAEQKVQGLPSDKKTYKKELRKRSRQALKEELHYDIEHPVETAARVFWLTRWFK